MARATEAASIATLPVDNARANAARASKARLANKIKGDVRDIVAAGRRATALSIIAGGGASPGL